MEDPSQPQRVVVFVDAQNVYRRARGAFFNPEVAHYSCGNVDPCALADAVVAANPSGKAGLRQLEEVRVYSGRPDSRKDPRTNASHLRQCAFWEKQGAEVITRPLRYPKGYPQERPEEKGIDVALAIDFVALAIDNRFDIGVIASIDTDLRPALEFVLSRPGLGKSVEVVAWHCPPHAQGRLTVDGFDLACHLFEWPDFQKVRDHTDYTTGRKHFDDPSELHPEIRRLYPPPPPPPPAPRRRR